MTRSILKILVIILCIIGLNIVLLRNLNLFSVNAQSLNRNINVMTFNYKYIKPHNLQILKSCVISKNLDFFGFQEMNFMDGADTNQMRQVLATAGYRSDNISTRYTNGRREHLLIFYKDSYQYVSGPEESIIGGGSKTTDDTRKILTVRVKDPATGIEFQVFNHHPVSGENEQSCTHNKASISFVQSKNNPYTVFFGDYNLQLNSTDPKYQTSCNPLYPSLFSISCHLGQTTTHSAAECGGKDKNNGNVIDYVMTPLSGNLQVIDSYYDTCGFSIGDSGSFDSDHYPLFATLAEKSPGSTTITQPSTTSPGVVVFTPTQSPTPMATFTPTPTWITYATPTCAPPIVPHISSLGIQRIYLDTHLENIDINWEQRVDSTMLIEILSNGQIKFTGESQPRRTHYIATISNADMNSLIVRIREKNRCGLTGAVYEQTLQPLPTKPPRQTNTPVPFVKKPVTPALLIAGSISVLIIIVVGLVLGV